MPKTTRTIKRPENRPFRIIGLMSGTSMDGIDAALLETDGEARLKRGPSLTLPYPAAFRKRLAKALGKPADKKLERDLAGLHALVVLKFLKKHKLKPSEIHALGFHGHTLLHAPDRKITVQAGDGKLLAKLTSIPVVYDFRRDDVKAGGQGAPLVPVYHRALAGKLKKPVAFLNIGGVANLTFIGKAGELHAFDTGPGNAQIDDWMRERAKKEFDRDGKMAAKGRVDKAWVKRFLRHAYFKKRPPKSLDRGAFRHFMPRHLTAADGAATLTAMTVEAVAAGVKRLPRKPLRIVVCGGGRKNAEMMRMLEARTGIKTVPVEKLGFNGDAIEAEAFAYIAARVVLKLPYTFRGTTGRKGS